MTPPVLLDTGCVVALLDSSERFHALCVETIQAVRAPLVTCEAVIAESCYLLRKLRGAPEAILANVQQGRFAIPFRLDQSAKAVGQLMSKYGGVPMDFADACLVHMADELETPRILTLDSDFSVYRWRGRRPFENLLPLAGRH